MSGSVSAASAVDGLAHQVEHTMLVSEEAAPAVPQPPAHPPTQPAAAVEVDLLGFGPDPTPPPAAPTPAPVSAPPPTGLTLTLNPSVSLSGDEYQSKWGAVADADAHVIILPLASTPSSTDAVETPLDHASVKVMASGELPTELKFFLYAQDATDGAVMLVQASIAKGVSPTEMLLTVKISGNGGREKADAFGDLIKSALSMFIH